MKPEQVVVAAMRTKGITKFAMLAAEPAGSIMALEAAQLSYPALDAAMVLLGSKIANDQARLTSPQSLQTRLLHRGGASRRTRMPAKPPRFRLCSRRWKGELPV